MDMIFGGAFILSCIISIVLSMLLGQDSGARVGAMTGFMIGLLWVATAMGITYLFERKSLKLFLINVGYHVITFTVMGFILGIWN